MLTSRFINRLAQFGSVTYDLLLEEKDVIKHRIPIKISQKRDSLDKLKELASQVLDRIAYRESKEGIKEELATVKQNVVDSITFKQEEIVFLEVKKLEIEEVEKIQELDSEVKLVDEVEVISVKDLINGD